MLILENIFDLSNNTFNLSDKDDYTLIMAFLLIGGWNPHHLKFSKKFINEI